MKALLDTHTFLWAIAEEAKLSRRAQQIYTGSNDLWLSVASVWEILIKVQAANFLCPSPQVRISSKS
jgi:PIN domain nuclease of toxin-antitoxin system